MRLVAKNQAPSRFAYIHSSSIHALQTMSEMRKRALEHETKIGLALQALSVIPKPSVSSIARKFGISPSTLQFRVNGGQNRVAAHEDQMPVKLIQEEMLAN